MLNIKGGKVPGAVEHHFKCLKDFDFFTFRSSPTEAEFSFIESSPNHEEQGIDNRNKASTIV